MTSIQSVHNLLVGRDIICVELTVQMSINKWCMYMKCYTINTATYVNLSDEKKIQH